MRLIRSICLLLLAVLVSPATAQDRSAPAILQMFEARWQTVENRTPDIFRAGYGGIWLPPVSRADSGNFSVGYDVYDRFDLGGPERPTLYGTETGLKTAISTLRRANTSTYLDLVWNHNGFSDLSTPGFVNAGGYPGFLITHPNNIDGDFHSPFAGGVIQGRLSGLIDIAHQRNFQYIRNPVVPGDPRNLPAGTTPAFGRLANVPTEANRRFYPDRDGPFISVFDPMTGESNIRIYQFTGNTATTGDPVPENALGYLMRHTQWLVQEIGADGFRLDAVKHMEPWVLNYFDRAVYRSNPRRLLDGSTKHVFSFGEALDGSMALLQSYTRKDINPNDPGRVGGNRDALDFPLHFALKANLSNNGVANDWRNVINASFDINDDGIANNGSQGVAFDASHDDGGAYLGNVANAYLLMRPGNAIVYMNAKEFGPNRDFPRDGRGDALGGVFGNTIPRLVQIRNSHGRGNFIPRLVEKETMVYERDRSAVVVLSNRLDAGFDARTVQTSFAPGTALIELTGNASDPTVDPFNDIPELLIVDANGRVNLRAPRNRSATGVEHGKGYVIYGLATPQGELTLSNVAMTLPAGTPTASTNGTTRLAPIPVITADTFNVSLQTVPVNLLGFHRDPNADGDNALLRFNEGVDINRNGNVDFRTPGTVAYGFENFTTKRSPLVGGGDGQFIQLVHTDDLVEGMNFLEVIAFRHRTDGGPPVYTSWREAIYVDRLPPESAIDEIRPLGGNNRQVRVRSVDKTANSVHTFLNLPASVSDQQILSWVSGSNQAGQIDRDLFAFGYNNVPTGNHVVTVVSFEITGNVNVQRFPGQFIQTNRGAGLGDLNFDGVIQPGDIVGPGSFEQVLYSRNTQFNPAADINGDGLVDNRDLYALEALLVSSNASPAVRNTIRQAVLRRGDVTQSGSTNAADIDFLYANFGSTSWLLDLDVTGVVGQGDVNTLVGVILQSAFGDANLDGRVDKNDLVVIRRNLGRPGGWADGDFDGDGMVTELDLQWFQLNFNFPFVPAVFPDASGLIPEPASLSVVLILLPLLSRRSMRPKRGVSC